MLFSPSKKSLTEIFSSGPSLSTLMELMTLDLTHPFTGGKEKDKNGTESQEYLLAQGQYLEHLLIEKGLVTHERWEELLSEMAETRTPIAMLLVNHRIVAPESLNELAEELKREIEERTERGPSVRKIVVKENLLTPEQYAEAVAYAKAEGTRFTQAMLALGFLSFERVCELYKQHFGIEGLQLANTTIEFQIVHLVPDNLMRTHELLPFKRKGKKLHLAMSDPRNRSAIKKVEMMTNLEVVPHLVDRRDLQQKLEELIVIPDMTHDRLKGIRPDEESFRELLESDSAVKMVNKIIEGALHTHATDIHVEPSPNGLRIRYRIDGMLYDIMTIPRDMGIPTVSRIKVLSGMDLTERRRPQDGHISFDHDERRHDLRASTLPTHLGEKIVLRLHDESVVLHGLANLGFEEEGMRVFKELIHRPHGMILVTGPIGSGKTTTLYTAISEINQQTKNIVTLEDPIEYQIPGISQVQVDPKIGITFAAGLRSILRQDANILLVGEIRDPETATTAVRAANTGHLLFSSMHTNNAVSALTALQYMGVPPFQIATSLVAVIAQRLVRVLCPDCKEEVTPRPLAQRLLSLEGGQKIWQAKGCAACFGTGYCGRTGVFEIFRITEKVQEAIIRHAEEKELTDIGIEEGMVPLNLSAGAKVLTGLTSFDEVSRVVVLQQD